MLYKLDYFDVSYALIAPFKFETDSRDLLRTYTTFALIRDNAIVYCRKTNRVLTDTDRAPIIDGLIKRIYLGFDWKQTSKTKKYPIRRYRLVEVLNSPDIFLTRDLNVHHRDGIDKLKIGDVSAINDTLRNLKVMSRADHRTLHHEQGDFGFSNM